MHNVSHWHDAEGEKGCPQPCIEHVVVAVVPVEICSVVAVEMTEVVIAVLERNEVAVLVSVVVVDDERVWQSPHVAGQFSRTVAPISDMQSFSFQPKPAQTGASWHNSPKAGMQLAYRSRHSPNPAPIPIVAAHRAVQRR